MLCEVELQQTRDFVDRTEALGIGEMMKLRDEGVCVCVQEGSDETRTQTS